MKYLLFLLAIGSILYLGLGRRTNEKIIKQMKSDFAKASSEKEKACAEIKKQVVVIEQLKIEIKKLQEAKPAEVKKIRVKKPTQRKVERVVIRKKVRKRYIKKKIKRKVVVPKVKSRKVKRLEQRVRVLNSEIAKYQRKVENPTTLGLRKMKKGWVRRSRFGSSSRVFPISTMPKNKKGIKTVFYSRAEQKQMLKKKYFKILQKLKREKANLLREIAKAK